MNAKNNANTDESESHDTSLKLNFKVSYQQISVLDIYAEKYPSKRKGFQSKSTKERQDDLKKSKKYPTPELDIWETKDCKAMHPWQLTSFPTCNKLHEVDLSPHHLDQDGFVRIINHGYFRDVWTIHDDDLQHTPQVLKTLRYEHKYIDRNYDRHRRDAVAMERLTGSPYIVDIFGYCGNNGLFEYSPGGDIDHALFSKSSLKHPMIKYDRLRIAAQVANGIADAHHVDDQGRATIAHTDITGGQFVYVDGIFKLNDFNRARFLRFDSAKNETCGFRVGANRGDVSIILYFYLFMFLPSAIILMNVFIVYFVSFGHPKNMPTQMKMKKSMSIPWETYFFNSLQCNIMYLVALKMTRLLKKRSWMESVQITKH